MDFIFTKYSHSNIEISDTKFLGLIKCLNFFIKYLENRYNILNILVMYLVYLNCLNLFIIIENNLISNVSLTRTMFTVFSQNFLFIVLRQYLLIVE